MKYLCANTIAAGALFALSQIAQASVIYTVNSTPKEDCASEQHGLWTNSYSNSGCNEFYDFLSGSQLEVDTDEAVLTATAKNPAGSIATINITFGGFQETYDRYKNGGTPDYDGDDDPVDWDFFSFITDGTISFDNGDIFKVLLVNQPSAGAASPSSPVLQIGDGANDKSEGFGASAWLDVYTQALDESLQCLYPVANGSGCIDRKHWDLNISLGLIGSEFEEVPLPGSAALLGLGLICMRWSRRKN